MIRLQRPQEPPSLQRGQANALTKLERMWVAGTSPVIKGGIYNHISVKTALRRAQHDKCAYCETRDARSPGVIEHFRPKSGWKQDAEPVLTTPGYFWLAYHWANLLFACALCNDGAHKGNRFPLRNPLVRATPANRDIAREEPLLLDPYGTIDPEAHIEWDGYIPRPRNGSPLGAATIKIFGLDRDDLLIDERRSIWADIRDALAEVELRPLGSDERLNVKRVLLDWLDGSEEYTAMIRANFGDRIRAL